MSLWPATVSSLEVLSVLANVIGLIAGAIMLGKTCRRVIAVTKMPDYVPGGPRILAGNRHFRNEIGRLAFHVTSATISFWGFWYEPSGTAYGFAAMAIRVGLGVMFALFSLYDILSDKRLDSLIGSESSVLVASIEARSLLHAIVTDMAIIVGKLSEPELSGDPWKSVDAAREARELVLTMSQKIIAVQRILQTQSAKVAPVRGDHLWTGTEGQDSA